VSDTTVTDVGTSSDASTSPTKPRKRAGSLNGMVLAELQQVASGLGLGGTAKMRKGELIEAISSAQGAGAASTTRSASAAASDSASTSASTSSSDGPSNAATSNGERAQRAPREPRPPRESRPRRDESAAVDSTETVAAPAASEAAAETGTEPRAEGRTDQGDRSQPRNRDQRQREPRQGGQNQGGQNQGGQNQGGQNQGGQNQGGQNQGGQNQGGQNQGGQNQGGQNQGGQNQGGQNQGGQNQGGQNRYFDDDSSEGRRRRRGRGRDRDRRPGTQRPERFGNEAEPTINEDDVLVPVGGIVDIHDNYGFIRTSGYLPGPNDVYVTLAQVRKNGLRKGDAVTGAVKQVKEGERRDKFNALVRLDSVNGLDPSTALNRPEFNKLTPLYPQDRLRLEGDPANLTARVIDIVAPIGKGQRGLIVSPPKAGKTMVLQAIANSISRNNPEVHLMVVLVDERPEEVTDMQRSVKGEVIASTFDRPAEDHTVIAELAIERAKRLVELGHDVVVLLDSMTRLGRAYNLAAPASGRILSGGVDSSALYPPKRFFGAARNIEDGGSLTVIATALVETGSKMDDVIFEEFKGTGNMELKLDRRLADKRIFPAVDVDPSGTRKEEILLSPEELKIVWKLRRVLHALDSQQAIELLINKLRETKSNYEFLLQVAKTTANSGNEE